jgi:serine/threonine-protein kinase HipA
LSISFKDAFGELITDLKPRRVRVPPFFSNLLPEGAMREYLAKKAGVNAEREFLLLWMLGQDLPGAITMTPADGEAWPADEKREGSVESISRETLLRFSLAGVQLKFSAVMKATGGFTMPAEGIGGSWIVKLPSMRFEGVAENEFAMMQLARAIGIDVPEIRLIPLRGDCTGVGGLYLGYCSLRNAEVAAGSSVSRNSKIRVQQIERRVTGTLSQGMVRPV